MRVVFSPAVGDRGLDLIRIIGTCRSCKQRNIVWLVRGHLITMSSLACEHCGSFEGQKKKKQGDAGIEWRPGTSCWSGRTVGKNYPELAREQDLVV